MVADTDRGRHGPFGSFDRIFTKLGAFSLRLHIVLKTDAGLSFQKLLETRAGRMF